MNTTILPRNTADTPERWQAALTRAHAQGVTCHQIQCGAHFATSGTDADAAYLVTSHGCECAAGVALDPVCKHRAALREMLGTLAREAPEVPAVEADDDWDGFWAGLYATYPTIAPGGPVTSMSDLAIVVDARSLPADDGACRECRGYGYFRKESSIFAGQTFRVNCLACRGKGVKPAEPRRRIAA